MQQSNTANMQAMATQFGGLLEVIAPEWDGWKDREAMYGLIGSGYTPKQAYQMVKKNAPPASTPEAQQPSTPEGKAPETFDEAVEKRAKELVTQQRSSNAGITGRPERNDLTAPKLSARELNKQLYRRWVTDGEKIPAKYTRGL